MPGSFPSSHAPSGRVRIYSFAFGQPEFVAPQAAGFRAFLAEPHELVIVADGSPEAKRSIQQAARRAHVRSEVVPADTGNDPSIGLGKAMHFALRLIAPDEDITLFVHADLFPVAPLSLQALLEGFDVAAVVETKAGTRGTVAYPWSGFIAFRTAALGRALDVDFLPTVVEGTRCDTGGGFWHYWSRRPDLRVRALGAAHGPEAALAAMPDAVRRILREYPETSLIDGTLLHYLAGSDWDRRGKAFHRVKSTEVLTFVEQAVHGAERAAAVGSPAQPWPLELRPPGPGVVRRARIGGERVISFSLFNERPKDVVNAVINCMLAPQIYPGWVCRFYVDDTVPPQIERLLHAFDHVEVVRMPRHRDNGAMLWRFLAAADPTVDVMISRDADSWVSSREAACVNEWLAAEDRPFHIIRDHCYHSQKIMGGMWGVRGGVLPEMADWIGAFTTHDSYDQGFLAEYVYPRVIDRALIHVGPQRNRDGQVANYFDDGGVPMPDYAEVDEAVRGLSFLEAHRLNAFTCSHCQEVHRSYIGAILEHIPLGARRAVRDLACSVGVNPDDIRGLEEPAPPSRVTRWRQRCEALVPRLVGGVRRRITRWTA